MMATQPEEPGGSARTVQVDRAIDVLVDQVVLDIDQAAGGGS